MGSMRTGWARLEEMSNEAETKYMDSALKVRLRRTKRPMILWEVHLRFKRRLGICLVTRSRRSQKWNWFWLSSHPKMSIHFPTSSSSFINGFGFSPSDFFSPTSDDSLNKTGFNETDFKTFLKRRRYHRNYVADIIEITSPISSK